MFRKKEEKNPVFSGRLFSGDQRQFGVQGIEVNYATGQNAVLSHFHLFLRSIPTLRHSSSEMNKG